MTGGGFSFLDDGRLVTSRRIVLGTALAGAAAANVGGLLRRPAVAPWAGGVLVGRTGATTVLDPTSAPFGARGDGVVLGDLVTQAGSTTVSSLTAPFTSTEVDRGKLVVWRGTDGRTAAGTVDSVRSPEEAVLRAPASSSSRRDGGPNTNGAVGTDNTEAFNRAFASAQAAASRALPERRRRVPAVQVRLPRGVFLFSALEPFERAGVSLVGEGRFSTVLASVSDGAWLQLSSFSADPSDAFQGTAVDWTFQDLQFLNPAFGNTSSEGRRGGRAIQDNGSGGTRVLSCAFYGLAYGFCGAHGSDFSEIRESTFDNCDVGYYFGPGSQQLEITKTDAATCREGAVFEGAPHWHIGGGSSFEDPTVAAITIEAKDSGRTRLGVPVDLRGAFYSGKFLIDQATWFETNSGNNGRLCPRMIWVRGDGPFGAPVEGVVVRDAYVIAGGAQLSGGDRAFLELDTARDSPEPVVIEDLVMGGNALNAVFRMSGTAETSRPRIARAAVPGTVRLTIGRASGAKILLRDGSMRQSLRVSAAADGGVPLQLVGTRQQGAAPLLGARPSGSDGFVAGLTGGGAVFEAFAQATSSGGGVEIDADRCNHFACTLNGGRAALRIINPPANGTQRLLVEVIASGAQRAVGWPTDCRFANGAGPATVAAGTRTCVTLVWNPSQRVWIETGRSEGVTI